MIRAALAAFLLAASPPLATDAPDLVRDFPGSLSPRSSLALDSLWTTTGDLSWLELTAGAGHLFFTAHAPGQGREWWAIGDRELPRRRGVRK